MFLSTVVSIYERCCSILVIYFTYWALGLIYTAWFKWPKSDCFLSFGTDRIWPVNKSDMNGIFVHLCAMISCICVQCKQTNGIFPSKCVLYVIKKVTSTQVDTTNWDDMTYRHNAKVSSLAANSLMYHCKREASFIWEIPPCYHSAPNVQINQRGVWWRHWASVWHTLSRWNPYPWRQIPPSSWLELQNAFCKVGWC